jgi:predicted branched-subunit amino acid permease
MKVMKTGQIIGLSMLIGGIILVLLYSMIESIQNINIATVPIIIALGVLAVIIGVISLLISITIEQVHDMNKRKEEIKKEDFEP